MTAFGRWAAVHGRIVERGTHAELLVLGACTPSSVTSSSWHRRLAARAVLETARYAQIRWPPNPAARQESEVGEKRVGLRHDGGLRFVATTGSGHDVVMDNAAGESGPRPTELLLAAIAGCTAMDVVEILAKSGNPTRATRPR